MLLALGAIVIGIRAVVGAVIAGSVVGYEVCVHCDFSCELFCIPASIVIRSAMYYQAE